jgi:glycine betaine catabolism A
LPTFLKTTQSYQPGARTMPGRYYTSQEVLEEERERLFANEWLCVGRMDEIAKPGDYIVREIAGESIIVVRDRDEAIRAFYNVCRHRGTRLCEEHQGTFSSSIQCPYHAWTYGLDGRLIGAPHMNEVQGFEKADYPLHSAPVGTWGGFIFLTLAARPRPLDESLAPIARIRDAFNVSSLHVGHRVQYDVKSNWKLVMQNYSECLHCPMIHPELSRIMPYQSGENDLVEGAILGGFMQIAPPNVSMTITGNACGIHVGELSDEDRQRAYYYTIFPNMMLSVHPDYVVYYMVWPEGIRSTRVVSEWMFHPDAGNQPGFNPADAIEFWDTTNRQDWHICEQSHAGIMSRVYRPGPYSPRESIPAAWDREYLRVMSLTGPQLQRAAR